MNKKLAKLVAILAEDLESIAEEKEMHSRNAMAERFSRKALYDLVWSEPMKNLATRFGVSDVALKKTCGRAGIPTPERGYWAKKEARKIYFSPFSHPVRQAWTMRYGLEVEEIAGMATPVRTNALARSALLQNLSSQSRRSRRGLPQRLVTSPFRAPSGFGTQQLIVSSKRMKNVERSRRRIRTRCRGTIRFLTYRLNAAGFGS